MQLLPKNLVVLCVLAALAGCGRTYEFVPDGFHGRYENANSDMDHVIAAAIGYHKVVLIDSDGGMESCHVMSARVKDQFFGKGKTTTLVCREPSVLPKDCPPDYPRRFLRWELTLLQEDSEEYSWIEIQKLVLNPCNADESLVWKFGPFSASGA